MVTLLSMLAKDSVQSTARQEIEGTMMARPMSTAFQWRVEETLLNALPALRGVVLEGWLSLRS